LQVDSIKDTKETPWIKQELNHKEKMKNRLRHTSAVRDQAKRYNLGFEIVETSYPKNLLQWSVVYQIYPNQVIPREYRGKARELMDEALENVAEQLHRLIYEGDDRGRETEAKGDS